MRTPLKLTILAGLVATVIVAVALKQYKSQAPAEINPEAVAAAANAPAGDITNRIANTKLPKLVDLGAGKCIPCKRMAPILEELKEEYAGKMNVEFIDVWLNPNAAKPYGIEVIPTQIFYDADGKEVFRHIGFFGKEEILGKWKELGVDLVKGP